MHRQKLQAQTGPVTDGFVQPYRRELADDEKHGDPMQGHARRVEASALRGRPHYDHSPRGFQIFDHDHLLQTSFDRKFTAVKTWTATILFRRKIIRVEGVIATLGAGSRGDTSDQTFTAAARSSRH